MGVTRFDLPDLGEGLEEAEIVEWQVAPGDRVVADQPLVSVETDKAVVEIPAPWSGVVTALLAQPGQMLRVGEPLAEFETAARTDPGAVVGRLETGEAPPPRDDAAPRTAPRSPATAERHAAPRPYTSPSPDAPAASAARPGVGSAASPDPQPAGGTRAMPAARALAARHGIVLDAIVGSGPGGVVTMGDVEAHLGTTPQAADGWEPLRGARRAMARRMAAAREVVRATLHDDADVTLWFGPTADTLARVVRATARGAEASPMLNAWFDADEPALQPHARLDLGLAVDTPEGLYVPVLRDAGALDATGIRAEADRLIAAARDHALGVADQAEATLTLSNFGPIGGRYAELVVSPPQVAILGAGRAYPVYREPGACMLLPLSLSFDHRAATGGNAARFMAAVIADLERPD